MNINIFRMIGFLAIFATPGLLVASGNSPWVASVTGGGETNQGFYIEWLAISVREAPDGTVSGMYEYANEGLQNWRYHGEPDCLAISQDGTRAVIIGPVTLSQGPLAPPLGTRVAFVIDDLGNGDNNDRALSLFAGTRDCSLFLNFSGGTTAGNYKIQRR